MTNPYAEFMGGPTMATNPGYMNQGQINPAYLTQPQQVYVSQAQPTWLESHYTLRNVAYVILAITIIITLIMWHYMLKPPASERKRAAILDKPGPTEAYKAGFNV